MSDLLNGSFVARSRCVSSLLWEQHTCDDDLMLFSDTWLSTMNINGQGDERTQEGIMIDITCCHKTLYGKKTPRWWERKSGERKSLSSGKLAKDNYVFCGVVWRMNDNNKVSYSMFHRMYFHNLSWQHYYYIDINNNSYWEWRLSCRSTTSRVSMSRPDVLTKGPHLHKQDPAVRKMA